MNVISKVFMLSLIMGLAFTSCKKKAEGKKATTTNASKAAAKAPSAAKSFNMDKGTLYWAATKVGGGHNGTINIESGSMAAADGKITNGTFVIDINSLSTTDLKAGEGKEKLDGHLKSGDFFDVAQFPKGTFSITNVKATKGDASTNCTITGNLTLKGVTKSVSIPASVVVAGNKISAVTPKFVINRTDWGIKYGSGLIGTAKDKIINDEISLNLEISATAQ